MPTPAERVPEIAKVSFACPHCGAFASQRWYEAFAKACKPDSVTIYDLDKLRQFRAEEASKREPDENKLALFDRYIEVVEREDAGLLPAEASQYVRDMCNVHVSECFACKKSSLWLGLDLLFPVRAADAPEPNADMPSDIKIDFDEAATIATTSPRSAAALLRLAIQKLCADVLGKQGDINAMIGELVKAGLPVPIQKALDVVRVIGNEAVHPGTIDLRDDRETVARLFVLLNTITEHLITRPRHLDELYEMIPASKRAGIEQRDMQKPE